MPPHVLHCWSYGQGRWRGHHWQWPRARLHQYQHLNPCSGCLRCSDAMAPTSRRRPSELAVDVVWAHHERFLRGFLRRPHSAQPTECGHRKKPRKKRSWWAQTTSTHGALSDSTFLLSRCTIYSRSTSLYSRPRSYTHVYTICPMQDICNIQVHQSS